VTIGGGREKESDWYNCDVELATKSEKLNKFLQITQHRQPPREPRKGKFNKLIRTQKQ